jgi:hypothetical protein
VADQLAVCCSVERSNASISLTYQIFIGQTFFCLWHLGRQILVAGAGQENSGGHDMSISSLQTRSGGMPSTAYAPEAGHFYRFYSIDIGGRIALAEDHECESDIAALALGKNLLSGRTCPTIEVWLERARIGVIENRSWLGA